SPSRMIPARRRRIVRLQCRRARRSSDQLREPGPDLRSCRWRDRRIRPRAALGAGGALLGRPPNHHQSWRGSQRGCAARGNPTEACQSLVFGDALGGAGCGAGDPSPAHYTGAHRDYTSGLDHMGARDYSSALGRWLTPDPAGLAAVNPNDPQSWNRYAYAENQPTLRIDPSGLLAVPQPCDESSGSGCDWNVENCTIDGFDSICNGLNGVGANGIAECPNNDCGMAYYDPRPTEFHIDPWGPLNQPAHFIFEV